MAAPHRPVAAVAGQVRIVNWDGPTFAARANELMQIYATAMGYAPSAADYRAETARRHIVNTGFEVRVAVDEGDHAVGFAYGYTTLAGQWWHDLVGRAIGTQQRSVWMADGFELSEIHVLPHAQARGTGRRLLLTLAGALSQQTILLSTPDADTRAFRLYRSLGFVDLARNYLFPGDSRPFAVMGARLPLNGETAQTPAPPDHDDKV